MATPYLSLIQHYQFIEFLCIDYSDTLLIDSPMHIQGSAKGWSPDLVNFVTAIAYHFCLALPAALTQPGDHLLAKPCTGQTTQAVTQLNER